MLIFSHACIFKSFTFLWNVFSNYNKYKYQIHRYPTLHAQHNKFLQTTVYLHLKKQVRKCTSNVMRSYYSQLKKIYIQTLEQRLLYSYAKNARTQHLLRSHIINLII